MCKMGTFFIDIELGGLPTADFVRVSALVDTNSTHATVPESVLSQIGVQARSTRRLRQADGQTAHRPLGQARTRVEGEEFDVQVIFLLDRHQPASRVR